MVKTDIWNQLLADVDVVDVDEDVVVGVDEVTSVTTVTAVTTVTTVKMAATEEDDATMDQERATTMPPNLLTL